MAENLHSIYYVVKFDEHTKVDIIKFYNLVFICKLRNFALSLSKTDLTKSASQQQYLSSLKPRIQMLSPQSPLMESLPPTSLYYTTIYSHRANLLSPNIYGKIITPRTQALYYFGESPSGPLAAINEQLEKGLYNNNVAQPPKHAARLLDYQQGENVGQFSHLNEAVTIGSKKLFVKHG